MYSKKYYDKPGWILLFQQRMEVPEILLNTLRSAEREKFKKCRPEIVRELCREAALTNDAACLPREKLAFFTKL